MDIIREKLPSGLRIIYVPMKGTQTVSVLVLVGVGSRYEASRIAGVSHFLEHMAFKGTVRRPDKVAIAQELDAVGAHFNAFTGKEYTGYWIKADRKHLALALDVLSDMYLHSTLPAAEIERERGVILGELDLYEDMPTYKVEQEFETLLYGDQPVGRDVGGTKESVRRVARKDLVSFKDDYYVASNTVVVLAGNIKPDDARTKVHKYFSQLSRGRAPKAKPVREYQRSAALRLHYRKTDQSHLVLGVRAFSMKDPRRWAMSLLSTVLGGNMSSRLFIKIREELGLGYYIRSSYTLEPDYGVFYVRAGVETKRLDIATQAILGEMKRLVQENLLDHELRRAIDYIRGSTLISLEESDNVAEYVAFQELLERKILTPEQKFRMLERVRSSDIRRLAQHIFRNERLNLALLGPHKEARSLRRYLTFT